MTQNSPPVKSERLLARLRLWADCHPRTGWYLTFFLSLNYILDILAAFL